MTAVEILAAIRRHHKDAAIVPEVLLGVHDYADRPEDGKDPISTRRIDALMIRTLERTAIEIKVSVADFKKDTFQKRYPWQRIVHRFVYAVPADLPVTAPHGCGLWLVHPDGKITVGRKAKINLSPEPLPQHVVQALAYRASRLSEIQVQG